MARWASARVAELTAGAESVPEYGSAAWHHLRGDDPRRAAALVLAAEQWRRHRARTAWLEQLRATDPDRWARTMAGTDEDTARAARTAAYREQQRAARRPIPHREPRPLRPSPGWPPVAIPGGRGRHLVHREAAA